MDILKKFLSRKFLAAAAGTTIGAAVALLGLDQSIIASCFGCKLLRRGHVLRLGPDVHPH